ncbi:MAG: purine-nucleoside phosphorylase [Armatimonadetes bacterium CG_4_10_14_3_um_filter_66_18]|nr:nucleoside phosphorylase [Armatimonadota bacterium]OIP01872.1 MAG: purine-nucleoside phosphorylase [Armatimonadetes bacterium CG2_30_66_41]PIU91046.1 MAG: purine-nucleoside phosphorylase [Armatimonadetes bacterium CG06_land_8_20_14_3_00_66_21]PIW21118.1 MAG: purine-nucleoside phosphorylase [Armatimonadetes bacterium CG17_big_fil_post_rev_8_21_14_2_50_66_6]PIX42067.1 MAG: purine-nucleoside phosphorylase [Armatimonadetes bacterium CG_4_8_14_3_um_filter_66_20]PIY41359.1 MAG: purine-nucleoside 
MQRDYPILEFDPAAGIIEPAKLIQPKDVPEHCVVCFFQEVLDKLRDEDGARECACLRSAMGRHPVYEIERQGKRLAVGHPGVGAPLAGAFVEELIATGCRKFVACGGCGVLDGEAAVGKLIVPAVAVRDEGFSYHYLPPGREVEASPAGVAAIEAVLREHGCEYVVSKTWTTDAFFRETPAKVALRRAEGCLAVEMEAAAFFAVAQFRGVTFAQLLYAGDDLSGEEWDSREWDTCTSIREELFRLAAEACLRL